MSRREIRTIPSGTEYLGKAALFVEVARAGSLSAAAKALGLARSTVSDHLQSLEEALGVRLVERSTRRMSLTPEGKVLLERMGIALDAWEQARAALDDRKREPVGRLHVTSPAGFASSLVAPVMADMMEQHAGLTAELTIDDRIRDLVAEGIDVAIRTVPDGQADLTTRLLGHMPLRVVASPSMAASMACDPASLAEAPWVGHAAVESAVVHLRPRPDAPSLDLRPRYRAKSSSSEGEIALVAGGAGIALMPWSLVCDAVEDGRLATVGDWVGGPKGLYAIFPTRALLPARTRVFLDGVIARFAAILDRQLRVA